MDTNNPSITKNVGGVGTKFNGPAGVKPAGVGAIKPAVGPTPAPRVETIVSTVVPNAPANDVQK